MIIVVKKFRYGLQRWELDLIFNWLASRITRGDKQRLNRDQTGIWYGKSVQRVIESMKKESMSDLRVAIRGILDAKRGAKAQYRRLASTLAWQDLHEIAKMLCDWEDIPDTDTVTQLRDFVIKKIQEEQKKHI